MLGQPGALLRSGMQVLGRWGRSRRRYQQGTWPVRTHGSSRRKPKDKFQQLSLGMAALSMASLMNLGSERAALHKPRPNLPGNSQML